MKLQLDISNKMHMVQGSMQPTHFVRGTVESLRALISALSLKVKQGEGVQSDITMVGHGMPVRIELIGDPDTNPATPSDTYAADLKQALQDLFDVAANEMALPRKLHNKIVTLLHGKTS